MLIADVNGDVEWMSCRSAAGMMRRTGPDDPIAVLKRCFVTIPSDDTLS